MKAICVDDERLILEHTVSLCRELPQLQETQGFTTASQALDWVKENKPDIAILDINMGGMNGLELAAEIKKIHPETAIIFLTGYSEYAVDAFKIHANGYLLKPVSKEQLTQEIDFALSQKPPKEPVHVDVQTFGGFDIFVDGNLVTFRYAKAKELLAYLIDRHGASVTRAESFAILWEDREYTRSMQKQLDVIYRSLRTTLKAYDIEDIIEMKRGTIRILPEKINCDFYRFLEGDSEAVNSYCGEYMSSYS